MKRIWKRALSWMLTLALACVLAVPAFAYEDTDPPQWEQYGYSSLEDMLRDYGMTEEEYYEWYVADALEVEAYLEEQAAKKQAWMESHSSEVAAFDPYAYFEQGSFAGYFYESPQEYMEVMELSDEAFAQEMLDEWLTDMLWQEEERQSLAQEKAAAGGSPEGINIMLDGQCIPFPDVRPQVRDGRTMAPLEAAMEGLGAEVSYDAMSRTAQVTRGEHTITHVMGSNVLTLPGGEQAHMDVSSYWEGECAMVPVVYFAQLLGYQVLWDEYYETVVLLDRQRTVEEIDQQFTLVNRLLYTLEGGGVAQEGESLLSEMDLDLELTMLDSLNGDKSYSMTVDSEALKRDGVENVRCTADLSELIDLYLDNIPDFFLTDEDRTQLEEYRDQLEAVWLEAAVEADEICLQGSLLELLGAAEDAETWEKAQGTLVSGMSVGERLTAAAFDDAWSPFCAWEALESFVEEIGAAMGDDCFTHPGSAYRLTWPQMLDSSDENALTLSITPVGERGCTSRLTFSGRTPESELTADIQADAKGCELECTFHIKNTAKGSLEMTIRLSATDRQPAGLPEDAAAL